ncbi:hypothetical protein [Mesorhizobium sp. LjNodule214]|uniref:hypothetical protein n=1 Tax=Mesorhizobium sp. LjNodule214 TaxID=3342252 RepID=UPI003ED028BC
MDIYSVAVTNIHAGARPAPMSARAEERYYSNQIALPHLSPGLLGSIAITAGVILILGIPLV